MNTKALCEASGVSLKSRLGALLVLIAVLAVQPRAMAQAPFYALIVNGSANLNVNYQDGFLIVRFRRARAAAGSPSGYVHSLPPGFAAWPDRPLNSQEPLVLRQRMSPRQAEAAINRLRQNGGYWKFYCRNTNAGYFEVSRSEATYASVRID